MKPQVHGPDRPSGQMQNRNVLNTAAFTFKYENDWQWWPASQQNNKNLSERKSNHPRRGACITALTPRGTCSPDLQVERQEERGLFQVCVTLNSHSFHSSTSVTLHLKYYELVLHCVFFFLFWSSLWTWALHHSPQICFHSISENLPKAFFPSTLILRIILSPFLVF